MKRLRGMGVRSVWVVVTLGATGVAPTEVRGQSTPPPSERNAAPMILTRLERPITLDGVVGSDEWAGVEPLPLIQYSPAYGGPPTERSEILVAYDDEYLYAAGRFWDSDPDGVRGNSLERDGWNGDDHFDLLIDGFNDDQTAVVFTTTPLGMQQDVEIFNDAERSGGVAAFNKTWDTFWDARGRTTPDGWSAEMRIPLSSLRFRVEDGRVVMGISASRYIARKNEKQLFPDIAPTYLQADLKPSLARDVVLEGVERRTPVYVAPYLLSGGVRQRRAGIDPLRTEEELEIGGEVKYGLTDGLTLDVTANTDFAQVEADAVEVNMDRFNLFFPERRQFFQERSSIFEFIHGDEGRLFHSRRIGLDDDGRPLRILGGARVAGRLGAWDVGLLNMQIDGGAVAADENDGVFRIRRDAMNGRSTVGGMLTTRVRSGGGESFAVGVDGVFRVLDRDVVTVQVAQSDHSGLDEGMLDRTMARLFWERPSAEGLGYFVDAVYSGSDYTPPLGFQERSAFASLKGRLQWSWLPEAGTFRRHSLFLTGRHYSRTEDGSLQTALLRLRWTGYFRRGGLYNIALNHEWESVRDPLTLAPGVTVPAGRYLERSVFTNLMLGNSTRLSGQIIVWVESLFDGYSAHLSFTPSWAVSPHLTLGGELRRHHVWFPSRDQKLDPDIYRLRMKTALDNRLSGEVFVQYSRVADRITGNFRIRYRFSEGRDLFLVYDHIRDVEAEPTGFEGLGLTDQRLLVKYRYTFH